MKVIKYLRVRILVLLGLLNLELVAQNYDHYSSTGTTFPYDYSTSGPNVLGFWADEVLSHWQTIPFNFSFYGQLVTGYYVSDNGYITFNQSDSVSEPNNISIPNVSEPNNAIYAFWDDMRIEPLGTSLSRINTFTYGETPHRVHVIQWYGVTSLSASGRIYSAIRLYECGDFDVVLNQGSLLSLTGTIGCENVDGSKATQVMGSPGLPFPQIGQLSSDDVVYNFHWDEIEYDMAILSESVSNQVIIGNNVVSGTLVNLGSTNVSSFDVNYTVDGGIIQTATVNANVPPINGSYTFTHTIPWNVNVGATFDLCIWVDNINSGFVDERTCNNEICKEVITTTGLSESRTTLIEEFVGTWCGSCPEGDVVMTSILANNPSNVIAVSVHQSDSMAFSNGLRQTFDVNTFPSALINRRLFPGESKEFNTSDNWENYVISELSSGSPISLSLDHSYIDSNRMITITLTANFVDYVSGDLRFVPMIVEKEVQGMGLGFDQANDYNNVNGHFYFGAGDPIVGYNHKNVLRALPNGGFGIPGVIPGFVPANSQYSETFTYTLPTSYDETKIKLVGFVCKYDTVVGQRIVINAVEENLDLQSTGLYSSHLISLDKIYPNPSEEMVTIEFNIKYAGDVKIVLHDAFGKYVDTVRESFFLSGSYSLIYNVKELTKGNYFVSIISTKESYTKRLIVI